MKKIFIFLTATVFCSFAQSVASTNSVDYAHKLLSASKIYLDINDYEKAEDMAIKAVKVVDKLQNQELQINSYLNCAYTFKKQNKLLGLEEYRTKAHKLQQSIQGTAQSQATYTKSLSNLYGDDLFNLDIRSEELNKDKIALLLSMNQTGHSQIPSGISNTQEFTDEVFNFAKTIESEELLKISGRVKQELKGRALKNEENAVKILNWATQTGDKSLEARALGNWGLAMAKVGGKNIDAATKLNAALNVFYRNGIRSPETKPFELALENVKGKLTTKEQKQLSKDRVYAGIEVGAKGVKLSVVELLSDSEGQYKYKILDAKETNTEAIQFSDDAIKQTAKAVQKYFKKTQKDFLIPSEKIFIAISSGVKNEAEKQKKEVLLSQIQESIKESLKEEKREIRVLDADEEAELSHLGIIDKEGRYDAMIIDIGSGNTKGGFFGIDNEFNPFSVHWGTKSLTNAVTQPNMNITDFSNALSNKMVGVKKEIAQKVSANGGLKNKDLIVMSGGICWSIATLLKPEEVIEKAYIELSPDDVRKFNQEVQHDYITLINPKRFMSRISDIEKQKQAQDEIAKVLGTFDQQALMAGGKLLEAVIDEFNSTDKQKEYHFSTYGHIGWITGYVIRSLGGEK